MNSQSQQAAQPETQKTVVRVSLSSNKLKATVRVARPAGNMSPCTVDDILEALKEKNVVFGIDNQAIENIVNQHLYDESIGVAFGKKPIPGKDATLKYHFEEIQKLRPKEDDDGRIDYKDINFVRTAKKDQLLIEKIPAQEGTEGTDVHGQPIAAPIGKDVKIPTGSNTRLSEDGLKLYATADGSIVTTAKRTNVNEVHTVGGVNTKTGNIKHNGSLIIQGNVEANFEVRAQGDIEIFKNVSDAKVLSGGNIMVKGGFLGSRNGLLKAAGNVHCKYVNDQVIEAGQSVFVGGEVFNGSITAGEQVIVSGSRGRIVGGKITAKDEIKAMCLGSDAGTKTELRVAYDAKLMKNYYATLAELKQLDQNTEKVNEGLVVFYKLQMSGKLSPDKEDALAQLEEFKKELPKRKKELTELKAKLEEQIKENQQAHIIAVKQVFPGVILQFGVVYKEITDIMGPSYFSLEGSTIVHEEYRPGKDGF